MIGLILYWMSVYVLVTLALVLVVVGGYLRVRYPLYANWTRCHSCFNGYFVPRWEVEGFVCGRCRNRENHR